MKKKKKDRVNLFCLYWFEFLLLLIFISFSLWLMNKSFRYDYQNSTFFIARNEIGDFGLHLSLIRSFSLGNNFPPELPFFPGQPLPYHYYFDLFIGLLERAGIRIDVAFNGLSVLALSCLMLILYRFPQLLFHKRSKLLGIISVLLFLLPSSFTFVNFLTNQKYLSLNILHDIWRIPDYINKGPFDGSIISIFFTLNVYLNQRHLIFALLISFSLMYVILSSLLDKLPFSVERLVLFGVILGFMSRVHALIFFATLTVIFFLLLYFRRVKSFFYLGSTAILIFLLSYHDILFTKKVSHPFIHLGFLSPAPATLNLIYFWFMNTGVAFFIIPLSLFFVLKRERMIFFCVLTLFFLGNIFQFSYRIDHNHSLFNFFFIFCNFYIAWFLLYLWYGGFIKKILSIFLLFFLTISGVLNLMPIKNDYHYPYIVQPKNSLMNWIIKKTDQNDIFLAKNDLLDPVTMAGRRNYFGNTYYLSVMGYNYFTRQEETKEFFEVNNLSTISKMKDKHINFIVAPKSSPVDFNYKINWSFLTKNLRIAYEDEKYVVFKL